MPNSKQDALPFFNRFTLPGFGLPLNFIPSKEDDRGARVLFKNALNDNDLDSGSVQLRLTTLREFTMLHLMNQITDKPDWHRKVFEQDIVSKWKSEALTAPDKDISEKMVDWCIAELRYKAQSFEKTWAISVYNGDVVKSDHAVPPSLKQALKAAVVPLEQVPASEKDWHPDSDGKVLDLVHPSLFPLVYGWSRILPDDVVNLGDCIKRCGQGITIPIPPPGDAVLYPTSMMQDDSVKPFSRQFQWLPCDVDISGGVGNVKITSYINNLHPKRHRDLYAILEKIISHTIPLWNLTLTPLKKLGDFVHNPARIEYTSCEYNPDPENGPETDGPQETDYANEYEIYHQRSEWYAQTRVVVQPEPGIFEPPPSPGDEEREESVDLRRDYGERGLQIIIKLANIHLTPEKPDYDGGSWHVEGKLNEHICASAVYYYDSENITTSRIAFRQQSDAETIHVSYEQDHHDWLPAVFGCETHGPGVQNVGTVDTPEGRLLTWPNILQHQVQPFKLADPTKPGHRKILAFFLVDPNIRIISTANVPCQQRQWWSNAIQRENGVISALPLELQEHIFHDVEDFPISLEEAKELRLKLMEERKKFVVEHEEAFRQHEFSLCEH